MVSRCNTSSYRLFLKPVFQVWGDKEFSPNNFFNDLIKLKKCLPAYPSPVLNSPAGFPLPGMCRGQSGTPQLRDAVAMQRPFPGGGVRVLPRPRRLQRKGRSRGPGQSCCAAAALVPEQRKTQLGVRSFNKQRRFQTLPSLWWRDLWLALWQLMWSWLSHTLGS